MAGGSGEAAMSPPSSGGSGGGKRGRDPEEGVYVDNLHSHKRYLSEVGRLADALLSLRAHVATVLVLGSIRAVSGWARTRRAGSGWCCWSITQFHPRIERVLGPNVLRRLWVRGVNSSNSDGSWVGVSWNVGSRHVPCSA